MQYIGSRSNEKIKSVSFLKDRAEREAKQLFFFEGVHLFEEFVRFGHAPSALFVTSDAYKKYARLVEPYDGVTYTVSDEVYAKISTEQSPQGILCVSAYLPNVRRGASPAGGGIMLESVRDTGNLGGIIRTAASLGVGSITLSSDCADVYSPKTVRASMGAVFASDIILSDDLASDVDSLRKSGKRVFATSLYGETVFLGTFGIEKDDTFVFGNEGSGVTDSLAAKCDKRVLIPMSGKTESLNVAAASAVVMWEMVRNG